MRLRILILAAFVALVATGCGGHVQPPAAGPGGVSSAEAVQRFLDLARAKDYVQMGWVFGTAKGPVIEQWPRPEVEQRMYALASVLQHDSFVVGSGSPVPGRIGAAESFSVLLHTTGRDTRVPITTVRGPGGRWFVEQVSVQAVTGSE